MRLPKYSLFQKRNGRFYRVSPYAFTIVTAIHYYQDRLADGYELRRVK